MAPLEESLVEEDKKSALSTAAKSEAMDVDDDGQSEQQQLTNNESTATITQNATDNDVQMTG